MATKLITPEFRGSFVHLIEPHKIKSDPNAEPRYQITIPLAKNDPFWKKIDALITEVATEKFGKVPPKLKKPIKDGDEPGNDGNIREEFQGKWTLQASSKNKPDLVDAKLQPIMDAKEIYSGAWFRASIRAYAWDHPTGGKGVSIALDNVMKVRDDKPFSGKTNAASDFADFADKSADGDMLD